MNGSNSLTKSIVERQSLEFRQGDRLCFMFCCCLKRVRRRKFVFDKSLEEFEKEIELTKIIKKLREAKVL